MSLLAPAERQSAVRDVEELILASGQEALVLRAQAGERLYGSDDESFAEVGTISLEFVETPPEDLVREKIDATADVLPSADVRAEDQLRTSAGEFRVQTVVDERLFGADTHKTLKLVRLHGVG